MSHMEFQFTTCVAEGRKRMCEGRSVEGRCLVQKKVLCAHNGYVNGGTNFMVMYRVS